MNTDNFGAYLRDLRKERRISLRAFCERAGADAGNISRLERRTLPPPQDRAILSRYAAALDLAEGSDEWFLFFDLAAADRGIIPRDIMDDTELVKELPAFFRTLRGQKPNQDELAKIVDKIRAS